MPASPEIEGCGEKKFEGCGEKKIWYIVPLEGQGLSGILLTQFMGFVDLLFFLTNMIIHMSLPL
jgi:hypothetical protein